MAKSPLAAIFLLAGAAALAGALIYYQKTQPPYIPPSVPVESPEQIARRQEIELLYPPNALKDPFEYEYPEDKGRASYRIFNVVNGNLISFLSAINEQNDEDFLSPVCVKKDSSTPPSNYFESWGIKLFGKGNLYRKMELYNLQHFNILYERPEPVLSYDYSFYSDYALKRSLELDDPLSWYYYAHYLFESRAKGYTHPLTPFQAMKKAADLGSPEAQLWVGDVYCLGVDTRRVEDLDPSRGMDHERVEVNPDLAMKYRQMALDNGERDALYNIGMAYYHGTCLPQDNKMALAYLAAHGGSPLVQQELFAPLSKQERIEIIRKANELRGKVNAVRNAKREDMARRYEQWRKDLREDVSVNQPWMKWAFVPSDLYERVKPELVQSALDKGLAYRDEDGQVYAVREITWPEYIEMDRENRIRKWEALTEEEKKKYPRPE